VVGRKKFVIVSDANPVAMRLGSFGFHNYRLADPKMGTNLKRRKCTDGRKENGKSNKGSHDGDV